MLKVQSISENRSKSNEERKTSLKAYTHIFNGQKHSKDDFRQVLREVYEKRCKK